MGIGARLSLREDIPADELRRLARQESTGRVACRLIALANALDGMSREQAARQAGMDRQTLRDWVIRCNTAGVEGLRDRPKSGRPSRRGLDPERDGVSYSGCRSGSPPTSIDGCGRRPTATCLRSMPRSSAVRDAMDRQVSCTTPPHDHPGAAS